MATEYLFSNNATTTLAQSVSPTATVLNVASGTGSLFPSPASGQAFAVTLVDAATGLTNEICYCTSRSGDQLTVIRGREGTNATTWQAGDTCANYITADVMESWLQESDLNGYLTQTTGDGRYVKKSGDNSTGSQYSTGWFSGGRGGGWNGARTNTGDYGWTNGLEFGNPANDGKYRGTWTVADVLNEGSNNSAGINLTGYDAAGTTYQWYFAWNGKVTTPGGVLAFESDLLAYFSAASNSSNVALTNLQGCNWTSSANNSYVQVTGNGVSLAVPTVAYTSKQVSDETTLREEADTALQNQINGKQPSGNYVTGTSAGKKIVTFTASVSGTQDISFSGLSSVDVVLGSCSTQPGSNNQRGGMIQINSWTNNSVNVTGKFTSTNISDSTDLPCYFVAIGDA